MPKRPPPALAETAAVEAGATGDKVPAVDPATAPLETDAETGGAATPSAAARSDLERRQGLAAEAGTDSTRHAAAAYGRRDRPGKAPAAAQAVGRQRRTGRPSGVLLAFLALLLAAGLAAWLAIALLP